MTKPVIFISHIGEESDIAKELKSFIEQRFLGSLDVFVSSHDESLRLGQKWMDTIEKAMIDSGLLIILCSSTSVTRPWINFEAGAGWIKDIPVIPICHSGLTPDNLPFPLSAFQGAVLNDPDTIKQLFKQIADILNINLPDHNDSQFYKKVGQLERVIKGNKININLVLTRAMLFGDIEKLKHSIYISVLDQASVNKIDIRHDDISKLNFVYSDIHKAFDIDARIALKMKKIFNYFYDNIRRLKDNVQFVLASEGNILPQNLKTHLSLYLIKASKAETWIDQLLMIDYQKKNSIRDGVINSIKESDSVPEFRYSNLNSVPILYYESLIEIQEWIVQYNKILNAIERKSD